LLIAQPAGSAAFPRRNWAVSTDGLQIGEVALTGWGVGTIMLRGESYSTMSAQAISYSLPREYHMRHHEDVVHLAREEIDFVYSIDNDRFTLRQALFWKSFGRSWPGFRFYRQDDRVPVGSIVQERALRDDVAVNLPIEITETLQLFLLWLVVDRAQWRSSFDNPA
jgi:hypothetical protein